MKAVNMRQRPASDFITDNNHHPNNNNQNNNDRLMGPVDNFNANYNIDPDDDPTFLRGSTVSQSFIKNIKSARKSSLLMENNNLSAASSTSNGFRRNDRLYGSSGQYNSRASSQQRQHHRRHRSAHELAMPTTAVPSADVADELESRYYEYNNDDTFEMGRNSHKRQSFKPRTIDRAVI